MPQAVLIKLFAKSLVRGFPIFHEDVLTVNEKEIPNLIINNRDFFWGVKLIQTKNHSLTQKQKQQTTSSLTQ